MGEKKWSLYHYYDNEGNYVEQYIEYEIWYEEAVKAWCCKKITEGKKQYIDLPKKQY